MKEDASGWGDQPRVSNLLSCGPRVYLLTHSGCTGREALGQVKDDDALKRVAFEKVHTYTHSLTGVCYEY